MKTPIAIFLAMMISGCITTAPVKEDRVSNPNLEYDYRIKSSGYVGCSPESISIEGIVVSGAGYSESWQALCHGQVFYCSHFSDFIGMNLYSSNMSCTEGI
jgi:hypothetical protein